MLSRGEAAKRAVIVMHYQNDIVDANGLYNHAGVYAQVEKNNTMETVKNMLEEARAAGIQVIYINNIFSKGYPELGQNNLPICEASRETNSFVEGSWGVENPEIIKPHEEDIIITNTNTSAFSYTTLDQVLRAKGIDKLYLAGVATNFLVDSTARYGSELGYHIYIIEDCCESFTDEMHEFAIDKILPKFAVITNSKEMKAEY